MPRAYHDDLRKKALAAAKAGKRRKVDICQMFDIHPSTLNKWIKAEGGKKRNQTTSQPLSDYSHSSSPDFDLFELIKYGFFAIVFIVVIASLGGGGTGEVSKQQSYNIYKGEIDTSSRGSIDANIRISANKNSKKVTTVANGEEVTVTEESDGWFKVTLNDGTKGWIAGNFVKKGQ